MDEQVEKEIRCLFSTMDEDRIDQEPQGQGQAERSREKVSTLTVRGGRMEETTISYLDCSDLLKRLGR
jgi:hypothetical protein